MVLYVLQLRGAADVGLAADLLEDIAPGVDTTERDASLGSDRAYWTSHAARGRRCIHTARVTQPGCGLWLESARYPRIDVPPGWRREGSLLAEVGVRLPLGEWLDAPEALARNVVEAFPTLELDADVLLVRYPNADPRAVLRPILSVPTPVVLEQVGADRVLNEYRGSPTESRSTSG